MCENPLNTHSRTRKTERECINQMNKKESRNVYSYNIFLKNWYNQNEK